MISLVVGAGTRGVPRLVCSVQQPSTRFICTNAARGVLADIKAQYGQQFHLHEATSKPETDRPVVLIIGWLLAKHVGFVHGKERECVCVRAWSGC